MSIKNTHIEHPEDTILTGDLSVLDWFTANSNISAKIDGAPAIVWGRNPATGKFFVGTKSVFNKKLIKINESHEDIDKNHVGNVADILHQCFDYLPHVNGVIQGDFIGFGGDNVYCPNTITYVFPKIVTQEIIIAPHTGYTAEKDLRDAVAHPLITTPNDNDDVLFVKPYVTLDKNLDDIKDMCDFARQMSTMCEFLSNKEATQIKKQLNACIREIIEIDDITLEALAHSNQIDVNVLRLWKLVQSIKHDMFAYIRTDNEIECYIEERETEHEGYVMDNEFGTYKIINRDVFSHANFTIAKSW
jgi:hypothetical protein